MSHVYSSISDRIASAIAVAVGTTACSSGGLYGVGVKTPFSRRIGASRSSKPASATCAAISAAKPHGAGGSSTISSRPVLATDCRIVSMSSGETVRGIDQFDRDAFCVQFFADRQRQMHHPGQGDDGDVSPGAHDRRPAELDFVVLRRHGPFRRQHFAMFEEQHRIVAPQGVLQQSLRVVGVDGTTTRRPGTWAYIA